MVCPSHSDADTCSGDKFGLFCCGCSAPASLTRSVASSEEVKVMSGKRSPVLIVSVYPDA
jgi:hypothetical protein